MPVPKHTDLTDEELLKAYRSTGDNVWLGYLLQRFTALLLGVAFKYLRQKSLAEDAVQQVFLKVITHLPQEEIANFKGWLYVLMRNHCLQQLRDQPHNTGDAALHQLPASETDKEEIQWKEHSLQQMTMARPHPPAPGLLVAPCRLARSWHSVLPSLTRRSRGVPGS